MRINDLENKKIAIWGLGIEGKAVLKVLNKKFPNKKIEIIDNKNCPINDGIDACIINQLKNVDIVTRSPGVSVYKSEIEFAKKNFGVKFITEKTLFFGELEGEKVKTIGITGTKGKTTTATFCAYILKRMGYEVMLAGNMGVPTIELIDKAKESDFVVIELSSYQTSDLLSFPTIGVLLNLFPEHIDWHRNHNKYYIDKVNLLNGVKYKIINGEDKKSLEYTENIEDKILFGTNNSFHYSNGYFYYEKEKLFSSKNMKLLGEHNYKNLCSVLTILKVLEIDLKKLKQEYFDEFKPIEHRLETIKHKDILFINDSISTIPETTIACYKIFKDYSIYGILGGFSRQQDFKELVKYIQNNKNIKFITLIGQTGQRLSGQFLENGFDNFSVCPTIKDCVEVLYQKAKDDTNPVIILSPASTSYDMYKNFEERGKDFKNIVLKLE